jgi:hypothetical protein
MLLAFNGTPSITLESKFWSLHCLRRGAHPQVLRGGNFGRYRFGKAGKPQVYEHGRWRCRGSSEDINIIHCAWTLLEKLQITLYCM